jgi:acetyl-CoA carboxylase alpha subunit
VENLATAIGQRLRQLRALSPDELVQRRYEKFRRIGAFLER